MVKPLSFKGDKPKKRKRPTSPSSTPRAAPNPAEPSVADGEEDTTWVSALTPTDPLGPLLILLPTPEPSALAADAHGAVFPSPISNIIDDRLSTAEPHDVRQVWVASRVAGLDGVGLKSSGGRYLGAVKEGLEARREARGVEEGWTFEVADGPEEEVAFWLRSGRGTYLTVSEDKDKPIIKLGEKSEASRLVVRMQAKFKPKLEAAKREKAYEKISRTQIEREAGRGLTDEEVKRLKRARKDGTYHEQMLDVRAKGKHDKFA
ncbi:hypothetical protein K461DRAFT_297954 [Myriangium duriaei CBS 260.36]|uniref:Uncharacterized protein n=1 Tax=Myriangium duriaei CBS 260.36 TaxID=1168546 RepID=A0A9P4IXG9_9PEZI|nr:hypothetical protein K461DRAFT_297954 [Myriangium duriaei CBS 260.36]